MKNNEIINTEPLVSIIVPTYNFGQYIEKCVCSLINQDYSTIEIIVINDGSKDETQTILQKLQDKDARIKVINKPNAGVSAARNDGLAIATGKYVMFVDGDDYLSTDAVTYFINLIESTKADFGLSLDCYTKSSTIDKDSDEWNILSPKEATALLLSPRVIVGCWNKIYNRYFLNKHGIKFNEDLFYGEGLRFITQVSQEANKIAIGLKRVYYYRRNNYSSATSRFNIRQFENGLMSINLIEKDLKCRDNQTIKMLRWHKVQFYMGIVIRIIEAGKQKEYNDFYHNALKFLRTNSWEHIFFSSLPLYNRAILIGTSLYPTLFAWLDKNRRKYMSNNSV